VTPTVRELQKKYGREVEFVWVDIDKPVSKDVMNRYGVRGIPTVVVLDSSGAKIGQWVGLYSPETYENAIREVLAPETSE